HCHTPPSATALRLYIAMQQSDLAQQCWWACTCLLASLSLLQYSPIFFVTSFASWVPNSSATSAAESSVGAASSTRGSEWKHYTCDSTVSLSLRTSDLVGVDDVGGRRPLGQVGVLLLVLVQLVVVAALVVLSS
ncbi:MAG: hypothetical protein MI748_09805, partial [Opitutales bacterium]|nr:hypothetical protein [Opitutales bacterium]